MTDAQLSAILTSILDILAGLNKRQPGAYYDDLGQTDAIAKTRELVASH